MTKQKNQPYSEIINLQDELKEYTKLCDCKSNKFTYYLDWKEYITKKLDYLDSYDKLENFKHYLLYKKRNAEHFNSAFLSLIIFALTFYLNNIFKAFANTAETQITIDIIFCLLITMYAITNIGKESKKLNQEYCYYCDLIEIIEEKQDEQKEG